jgi:hypothetical protein
MYGRVCLVCINKWAPGQIWRELLRGRGVDDIQITKPSTSVDLKTSPSRQNPADFLDYQTDYL